MSEYCLSPKRDEVVSEVSIYMKTTSFEHIHELTLKTPEVDPPQTSALSTMSHAPLLVLIMNPPAIYIYLLSDSGSCGCDVMGGEAIAGTYTYQLGQECSRHMFLCTRYLP